MDLYLLDNVNKLGACDFPTVKLSELEEHKLYKIESIKAIKTCFGRRIIIKVENIDGHIYLPERFNALTDQELVALESEELQVIYKGKKTLPNQRVANVLEFVVL